MLQAYPLGVQVEAWQKIAGCLPSGRGQGKAWLTMGTLAMRARDAAMR